LFFAWYSEGIAVKAKTAMPSRHYIFFAIGRSKILS